MQGVLQNNAVLMQVAKIKTHQISETVQVATTSDKCGVPVNCYFRNPELLCWQQYQR